VNQTSAPNPQAILTALEATIRAQVLGEHRERPQTAGPRLLRIKQAAEYLGRTESGIRQLIAKKILPVVRFDRAIRIDVRDLDKLIDAYRI
jgi:excisionase family DNA binding protein